MIYFCDRSMAHKIPVALSLLGIDIEIHDNYFDEKTSDDEWLERCAKSNWIALSFDRLRFLSGAAGRQAIVEHGAACFVFNVASKNAWGRLRLIAKVWDQLEAHSRDFPRPFLFQVNRDGTLIQKHPKLEKPS